MATQPLVDLYRTPGAALFLASAAEVEGVNGNFFNSKGAKTRSSKVTYDEAVVKRIWRVSEELCARSAS